MCSKPSFPGRRFTKAPKVASLTIVPLYRSPISGSFGSAIERIAALAASAAVPFVAPIKIVPSSSMEISAPVSS